MCGCPGEVDNNSPVCAWLVWLGLLQLAAVYKLATNQSASVLYAFVTYCLVVYTVQGPTPACSRSLTVESDLEI